MGVINMSVARKAMKGLTLNVPSLTYKGYTLFTFMGECGVWLIDMKGIFVHNWETPYRPGNYGKLLENGNLLYAAKQFEPPLPFGGVSGKLMEFDWDGNLVWEYEDKYMHHDFQRLPNGNTMILRFVPIPHEISSNVKGGLTGTEHEGTMWTDSFQEITPDGEVVWEWLAYEHLEPEQIAICPLCTRTEWTHANTCFVLPDGNILTCFQRSHDVVIVSRESGEIIWRWGQNGNIAHPHDAKMLDNGNILVFDNGAHRYSNEEAGFRSGVISFSRVIELDPESKEIVWQYQDEFPLHFFSHFLSGCQRLPNGNTLICEGSNGRFFEVTKEKELVWEYINPLYNDRYAAIPGEANNVFRAYRYAPDHPALKNKELNSKSVELTLRKSPVWEFEQKALKANKRLRQLGY